MKIMFLGTGAADYNWSEYGKPGISGSTSTLIDDRILIDCGPSVAKAMNRFGVPYSSVTDIVITHNHDDHFTPEVLKQIAEGAGHKIRFFASSHLCSIAEPYCEVHPLDFGTRFTAGDCEFLTLPANHTGADIFEKTFLYLISGRSCTLLYALDTAWIPTLAYRLLGKTRLDGAIWDATMSQPDDFRIFEHTDPVMFAMQRRRLTINGNMDSRTRIWFDHRAKTLWPSDPKEQDRIARRENVELAHDGECAVL